MQKINNTTRAVSTVLFIFGLLLALALAVAAFWPDFEANLFDTGLSAEETLDNLRCPMAITVGEPAQIEVSFSNSLDREVRFLVRSRISQGNISRMREAQTVVAIPPGETETLQWPVTADDAAYGRLIMARVYAFRSNPVPSRQQTCGILVLGIAGLTGRQIIGAVLVVSLSSMGIGAFLWLRQRATATERQRNLARVVEALAALILLSMIVSMIGMWALGVLVLVIAVLVCVAMIERLL